MPEERITPQKGTTMAETVKVMLLGDSIRMSYQPLVARLLEGKAEVRGPADNCQYTLYTLSSLGRWINELGKPDIVHWNNGLHDAGHNPQRYPVQIPIDMYRANLAHILDALGRLTDRIIWATTTPVHPERPYRADAWSWRNEEIDRYNRAARELMEERRIPINDLHAVVWSSTSEYLGPDQLHLSEAGKQACAEAVAESVARLLPFY
ncbi:MAG: GDSL-like Lipase/Acylhydrolase [Candidatus Latescibacteria bacterium ADurb.Bin168]|nr:MAG: GDSL-like Lipase/Acylhydrolase [Candidatus Latescibacteria bacterium ADurb.Bin168]